MSKKIHRVIMGECEGEVYAESAQANNNATVVPDSACFPVKEAMALCRASVEKSESASMQNIRAHMIATTKYLAAVERMKKKVKIK